MGKCVFLVYDYETQLPVACFDTLQELSDFLGEKKNVVSCGLCRFAKGLQKYVRDTENRRYEVYKIAINELI